MDEEEMTRVVVGALRATVKDHGPTVEGSWIGSAAKRIVGQIVAAKNERKGFSQPITCANHPSGLCVTPFNCMTQHVCLERFGDRA